MSFGNIGQNGVEEFFETILYQTAYTEAQSELKKFSNTIDDGIMKEAMENMMNVIIAGLIFKLIQMQEDFIQKVFNTSKVLILALLSSSYAEKAKQKLSKLKGFKFLKKLEFYKNSYSDRVATAQLVSNVADSHFHAERTAQSESNTLSHVTAMQEHIVNKESLNHSIGNSMASRYNDTLMFKLFTKSFTPNDEMVIKKILGRDTASELKIDDMNKVADFMFVTDANGQITGLTEQFFQLVNGLGYLHNK